MMVLEHRLTPSSGHLGGAETKKAWEESGGKKFTSAQQFRRYFNRTERFLDRLRALREEGLLREAEFARLGTPRTRSVPGSPLRATPRCCRARSLYTPDKRGRCPVLSPNVSTFTPNFSRRLNDRFANGVPSGYERWRFPSSPFSRPPMTTTGTL